MLEGGAAGHGWYITSFQACFRTRLSKKARVKHKTMCVVTGPCLLDLRQEKPGSLNGAET